MMGYLSVGNGGTSSHSRILLRVAKESFPIDEIGIIRIRFDFVHAIASIHCNVGCLRRGRRGSSKFVDPVGLLGNRLLLLLRAFLID